ncbi:PAS domain-containing protein [Ferrovibrio sp.]|uniref:PAS domain-containing protein n=1 Tax=Ferrovibrio sp. TaxID=1917215 RepID=UPI00260DB391|nr:PAS domain-containing protein [Ferrovibrio sp.]
MIQFRQMFGNGDKDGVIAISHPDLRALYDLWLQKRGGGPAPSRGDFAVEELRPWLGHLMIIDCDGEDSRYRLYGTELVRIFGFDLTGRRVADCTTLIGDKPMLEYREIIRSAKPVYISRGSPSAREFLLMDKLALPLMEDGKVNKILAAIYLSETD